MQATSAVPPAHQHEGVISVRLQSCDQLPLEVALDFHTLLVIEDLQEGEVQFHSVARLTKSNFRSVSFKQRTDCINRLYLHAAAFSDGNCVLFSGLGPPGYYCYGFTQ